MTKRLSINTLVVLAGLLAGLWSPQAAQAAQSAIAVDDDRGRRIEMPSAPQRIVSLLPSLTEAVCALQACARLVGIDRYSNWPAQVRALPKLGGLEDTLIERLVSLKPDLVLVSPSARALDRLEALGVRVMALDPQSLQDTERVMMKLAQALGDAPAGPALWRSLQARVDAAAARVPAALRGQKVYFEVASAPYAASESSFIGATLTRLGMGNVVPASLGPFPKLNPEFVVRAQPDILISHSRALAEMPLRPGWSQLRALRSQRHCSFSGEQWDMMVRPGPRLADTAEALAQCLVRLAADAPLSSMPTASR
jgi:iron complex transport system substrate-binding protein